MIVYNNGGYNTYLIDGKYNRSVIKIPNNFTQHFINDNGLHFVHNDIIELNNNFLYKGYTISNLIIEYTYCGDINTYLIDNNITHNNILFQSTTIVNNVSYTALGDYMYSFANLPSINSKIKNTSNQLITIKKFNLKFLKNRWYGYVFS